MQKGDKFCGKEKKKVLRVGVINPVEAAHYSQTYDGLKCISGEKVCASLELFSPFALWVKMKFSQPFKLYTASLKQGLLFSLFLPGNMFHEQSLKFSLTCRTSPPERCMLVA